MNQIEQKDYLKKILEAVESLDEGDNVFVTDIIKDLKDIDSTYDSFGDRVLSEEDIQLLNEELTKVRTSIVNVN
jgi:hypothetical protein